MDVVELSNVVASELAKVDEMSPLLLLSSTVAELDTMVDDVGVGVGFDVDSRVIAVVVVTAVVEGCIISDDVGALVVVFVLGTGSTVSIKLV